MSRYDSDGLRRVSLHLRAGVGVPTNPTGPGGWPTRILPPGRGGGTRSRSSTPRRCGGPYTTPGGRGAGGGEARTPTSGARMALPMCAHGRPGCAACWPTARCGPSPGKPAPPGCTSWPASGPFRSPGSVPFAPGRAVAFPSVKPEAGPPGPATASATRALVYTTPMARARRRVRARPGRVAPPSDRNLTTPSLSRPGRRRPGRSRPAGWEDFHPYSLVELDYGGLVHLVSDDALCGDQSVAEIRGRDRRRGAGRVRAHRRHVPARP